jgi:hypothetical protein
MKQTLSAFVMLSAALLIACSFGGPTKSEGDVIWPLAVGSEWQGTMKYYDLDGNLVNESPLTFFISDDTMVDNSKWYFFGTYGEEPPKVGTSYWLLRNQADGLHQIFLPIFFREPEFEPDDQLWFKYPTRVGDGYWVSNYDSITVRSVDQIVNAPQGTRRCILYEYYFSQGHRRYYIAPGVGIIRWEEYVSYDYDFRYNPPETPGWIWEIEKLVIK